MCQCNYSLDSWCQESNIRNIVLTGFLLGTVVPGKMIYFQPGLGLELCRKDLLGSTLHKAIIIPEKTFVTIKPYFQVPDTFHKTMLQVEKSFGFSDPLFYYLVII